MLLGLGEESLGGCLEAVIEVLLDFGLGSNKAGVLFVQACVLNFESCHLVVSVELGSLVSKAIEESCFECLKRFDMVDEALLCVCELSLLFDVGRLKLHKLFLLVGGFQLSDLESQL
jgi:hypothetical protein